MGRGLLQFNVWNQHRNTRALINNSKGNKLIKSMSVYEELMVSSSREKGKMLMDLFL